MNEQINDTEFAERQTGVWDLLVEHMIGNVRGAASYIIYSGVPENERITKLTDYLRDYLFGKNCAIGDVGCIAEKFEEFVTGGASERLTRPPLPNLSDQNEESRRAFFEEIEWDDMHFRSDVLARTALERILEEYRLNV